MIKQESKIRKGNYRFTHINGKSKSLVYAYKNKNKEFNVYHKFSPDFDTLIPYYGIKEHNLEDFVETICISKEKEAYI